MMMEMKDYNIKSLAAALMLVAALAGCTDKNLVEEPKQTAGEKTYTMTVTATKGDGEDDALSRALAEAGDTRALSLSDDGKTLNATWTKDDVVTVYNVTKGADLGGTLTAQSSGASTTLEGTLTGDISVGDELTLKFLSPDYDGQDGTLKYIAAHCDYAEATVTVASTDGGSITTTGTATFENQQAIVKFTLLDKADNSTAWAYQLIICDGTNVYTVTSRNNLGKGCYVALPNISDKTITLLANDRDECYTYQKSGVTFANGQYYEITVKMNKTTWYKLWMVTEDMTAINGDVLNGKLSSSRKISIADGATVVLDGVVLDGGPDMWAGITCLGDATIILNGDNTVRGFHDEYPGIYVPEGKTLTILGNGSLTATGGKRAAGIGSGYKGSCGNITITGGTVTATGGEWAAGIGSDKYASCGNITITGGTITATGGEWAAGIGSGNYGSCGNITITDGVTSVTATKGDKAPNSIGYGDYGTCGTVTIGGAVTESIPNSPYIYDPTTPTGTIVGWITSEIPQIHAFTQGSVYSANNENIGGSGINITWSGGGHDGNGWSIDKIRFSTSGPKLTFTYSGNNKKISAIDITAESIYNATALSPGWAANDTRLLWIGKPSKTVDLYVTESVSFEVHYISSVKITLVDN